MFQTQNCNQELSELKKNIDIINEFESIPKFQTYQRELLKEPVFRNKYTICFDILSVFLAELDALDPDDFELIEKLKSNQFELIIV